MLFSLWVVAAGVLGIAGAFIQHWLERRIYGGEYITLLSKLKTSLLLSIVLTPIYAFSIFKVAARNHTEPAFVFALFVVLVVHCATLLKFSADSVKQYRRLERLAEGGIPSMLRKVTDDYLASQKQHTDKDS